MQNIHEQCVKYGKQADSYTNYVKGASGAGFMKVAKAMMAQGILLIRRYVKGILFPRLTREQRLTHYKRGNI